MDIREFNEIVKPYAHGDDELVFDVRPFGARQGEAIDTYLKTRLMHVNSPGMGNTCRLVVLLCDAAAEIPESATKWVENLAECGQWAEIRHGCRARFFAKTA